MKLTIDETACKKHGVTVPEALFALAIRNSENPMGELLNMENREIIVKNDDVYMITQHWSDVLDEIIADSSGNIEKTDEELTELAIKMREVYPEGKQPGSVYFFRCNKREVMQKLKKFFLTHGNYTDEQILDATKRFVDSFHSDYRFLPLIKYFISKQKSIQEEDGTVHNVEYSPLADYLENEGGDIDNSSDWLINMK